MVTHATPVIRTNRALHAKNDFRIEGCGAHVGLQTLQNEAPKPSRIGVGPPFKTTSYKNARGLHSAAPPGPDFQKNLEFVGTKKSMFLT